MGVQSILQMLHCRMFGEHNFCRCPNAWKTFFFEQRQGNKDTGMLECYLWEFDHQMFSVGGPFA